MSDPAKDDRDDVLLRRLYDEPGAGDDDLVERGARDDSASLRRVRGAFHEYARDRGRAAEPRRRRLLAVARAGVCAPRSRERPGLWAGCARGSRRSWRTRAGVAAMVVVVAGIAGILYLRARPAWSGEVRGTGRSRPRRPARLRPRRGTAIPPRSHSRNQRGAPAR
jgi:hypothetical protein